MWGWVWVIAISGRLRAWFFGVSGCAHIPLFIGKQVYTLAYCFWWLVKGGGTLLCDVPALVGCGRR